MDFNGNNRGYAFVTFCTKQEAKTAMKQLNNYEIRLVLIVLTRCSFSSYRRSGGNISEHWVESYCLSGPAVFSAYAPVLTTVVYLWVGFPKPRSVKRSCQRWRKLQMVWWTSLCIRVPLTNPRTEALPSSNMRATGQQLWPAANSYQVTARKTLFWVVTAIGYRSSV